jgi:hypothetical protein
MNTQLVDSIVQTVETLPPAEGELVKQKLDSLINAIQTGFGGFN